MMDRRVDNKAKPVQQWYIYPRDRRRVECRVVKEWGNESSVYPLLKGDSRQVHHSWVEKTRQNG